MLSACVSLAAVVFAHAQRTRQSCIQQVPLQATFPSDGDGWPLETQYKKSQLMIVVMYTATLGILQVLRMPSVDHIGKLLIDIIKSHFPLRPSFIFDLLFHAVFSLHVLSPILSS